MVHPAAPHLAADSNPTSNRMLLFGGCWAIAGCAALLASYGVDAGAGSYVISAAALTIGLLDVVRGATSVERKRG